MDYEQIIDESRKTGVPVYAILEMFWLLKNGAKIENNLLVQKTGVASGVLNLIKKDFSKVFNPVSHTTSLNEQGLEFAKNITQDFIEFESGTFDFKDRDLRLDQILSKYSDQRPSASRKFDQFTSTKQTVKKRAILMQQLADVKKKRILFLGDDDFTSIAVASFGTAKKVVAADIDERILSKISSISAAESLGIETVSYNAKDEVPEKLKEQFDIVFTDPPYTPQGVELFISRAIECLDIKNRAARIYLCYGNSDRARERFLPIYQKLIESGLFARFIFDKFNRYNNAESIGSTSSLFVLDVTPKTNPTIKGAYRNENIYTAK